MSAKLKLIIDIGGTHFPKFHFETLCDLKNFMMDFIDAYDFKSHEVEAFVFRYGNKSRTIYIDNTGKINLNEYKNIVKNVIFAALVTLGHSLHDVKIDGDCKNAYGTGNNQPSGNIINELIEAGIKNEDVDCKFDDAYFINLRRIYEN